jgi:hypothetical protein
MRIATYNVNDINGRLPARRPGFSLLRPVSPTGRGATQREREV